LNGKDLAWYRFAMKKIKVAKPEWWEQGVRFECQGSGRCCVSRGEFGFVYLTLEDRKRMGKLLKISTGEFTRRYTAKTDGVYHVKDAKGPDCLFLKNNRCEVYEARPVQCRTWPFWPEVMGAKTWAKEVKAFCPGVGKGKTVSAQDIRATLAEQTQWETDLTHGR
jgi:Fe-S-cluster containining protein